MLKPRCKNCDWEHTVESGTADGKQHYFCLKCACRFTERDDSTSEDVLLRDTDYYDIWKFEEKIELVYAVHDMLIYKKCNYGREIEKLNTAEKAIYVCIQLENSINNGGFPAFVYNYSDMLISDVVNSFTEIGAHKTAEIFKKLLDVCEIPMDFDERNEWIIDTPFSEIMEKCDDDFYKKPDNLEELYYQYIMKNKEQFTRT